MTKVISVVSKKKGEGKTILSMNLAYALNILGYDVTLIDADKKNSGLSSHFCANPSKYPRSLKESIVFRNDLKVINSEFFFKHLRSRKKKLDIQTDFIILDSGEDFYKDKSIFNSIADSVIVVSDRDNLSEAKDFVTDLEKLGSCVLGVVVNRSDESSQFYNDFTLLANLPNDKDLRHSMKKKEIFVNMYPTSEFKEQIFALARAISEQNLVYNPLDHILNILRK